MIVFLMDFFGINQSIIQGYPVTRMVLAALGSLFFVILCGPFFIHKLYELKTGQTIRVESCPMLAKLHEKKKDTPTMGGVLIILAMIFSLVLWMDWKSPFTLILLLTTVWLGLMGGIDDYLKMKYKNSSGMKARVKFLLQIALGLIVAWYITCPCFNKLISFGDWHSEISKITHSSEQIDFYRNFFIPFVKNPLYLSGAIGSLIIILIIVFVVTGSSNAVNLSDGLDGLASGCLVLVAGVLAVFALASGNAITAAYFQIPHIKGSIEIAIYLSALSGACIGFLWFNGYPAQIFMGDTGSLTLGGVIGVSAVLMRKELLLGIIGGIFVVEALSVILQVVFFKLRHGKRIFLCSPIHHHFECKGWPETKIVMRFWIIGAVLAIIGLYSL